MGSAAGDEETWYFHNKGTPIGPMTFKALKERLIALPNWEDTYVWRTGYAKWLLAKDVEQVRGDIPPPLEESNDSDEKAAPKRGIKKKFNSFFWGTLTFVTGCIALVVGKDVSKEAMRSVAPTPAQQIEESFKQAVKLGDSKLPMKIDEETTLTNLSSIGTKLFYHYRLSKEAYSFEPAVVKASIAKNLCPSYLNKALQAGAQIEYQYDNAKGNFVGIVTMTKNDCGPYEGKG
jgi:hypothetical protein